MFESRILTFVVATRGCLSFFSVLDDRNPRFPRIGAAFATYRDEKMFFFFLAVIGGLQILGQSVIIFADWLKS